MMPILVTVKGMSQHRCPALHNFAATTKPRNTSRKELATTQQMSERDGSIVDSEATTHRSQGVIGMKLDRENDADHESGTW